MCYWLHVAAHLAQMAHTRVLGIAYNLPACAILPFILRAVPESCSLVHTRHTTPVVSRRMQGLVEFAYCQGMYSKVNRGSSEVDGPSA